MSDWGTPVMLLGKTPQQTSGPRSLARTPRTGALAGLKESTQGVDWGFLLGSYAGSLAGGAAVGFVVGRDTKSVITGGLAASGIWGIGETVAYARARNPWLSGAFVAVGVGSVGKMFHGGTRWAF